MALPDPAAFQDRLDRFIGTLQQMESKNNRSEPGYEARYSIRTETTKAHVAVYRCAEYRVSGHGQTLHRDGNTAAKGAGAGRIFCFVDRASGDVLAKRNSKLTERDLPSGVVLGNIFDEDNGLGQLTAKWHQHSDADHTRLRGIVEQHLTAGPGEMVELHRLL